MDTFALSTQHRSTCSSLISVQRFNRHLSALAVIVFLMVSQEAMAQSTGDREFSIATHGNTQTTSQIMIDSAPYVKVKIKDYWFDKDPHGPATSSRFRVTVHASKLGTDTIILKQTFLAKQFYQNATISTTRLSGRYYYYAKVEKLDDNWGKVTGRLEVIGSKSR